MSKLTSAEKPRKPYPDFPLFPHAARQWAKKIRGKVYYFGRWADPDAALQKYLDQKDDLHAGRTPRVPSDGLTMRDLVNRFLTSKQRLVDAGELTERTFLDYHRSSQRLVEVFGKKRLVADLAANDFEDLRAVLAKGWGPVTLTNEIGRIRVIFNYAFNNALIDTPIRYGSGFAKPSPTILRKARNTNGLRMFEAEEIRQMLGAAGLPLKAMMLLGINCAFGNSDCATLPQKALDLDHGWVAHHRLKTGAQRRCPIWPETVVALRQALESRPKPKDKAAAKLVFITSRGQLWDESVTNSSISRKFGRLIRKLNLPRPQRGFYALRHTFETIGGDSRDQIAVDHIMGHAPDSRDMSAVYRERISDERLLAVVDHVRRWLFGEQETTRET